jgi:enamine deaminase RidA (YjgF/YER057c/UK114 family)
MAAIERLSPAGMHHNPAYSQGIRLPASAHHILVGGQNGVDAEGRITGEGDLAAQTSQALANVAMVLEAGGARPEDLVSLSIYLVGDLDLRPAFGAWMAFWAGRGPPPAVKMLRVAGLANPAFLIEIEALAAVVEG